MNTWDNAIKQGLYMFVHGKDYAYFYGAKGQILTDDVMNYLIKAYPTHFARFTSEELERIKAYSIGKIGIDCSGFVSFCTGDWSNSTGQIKNCSYVTDDLVSGVAGSLLWKPSHIGIDVGYGYFLHCPIEGHTIEMGKISEYNWTKSGRSIMLDYKGANNR